MQRTTCCKLLGLGALCGKIGAMWRFHTSFLGSLSSRIGRQSFVRYQQPGGRIFEVLVLPWTRTSISTPKRPRQRLTRIHSSVVLSCPILISPGSYSHAPPTGVPWTRIRSCEQNKIIKPPPLLAHSFFLFSPSPHSLNTTPGLVKTKTRPQATTPYKRLIGTRCF
jgi:hypothetical protein